jgi:hypothetical protein
MAIKGEAIGGWATAAALLASIFTFVYTYRSQEEFNRAQLDFMQKQWGAIAKGLELQAKSAEEQHGASQALRESAKVQRESAAVAVLGRYLADATPDARAWSSAEAIIDIVEDDYEPWHATAKRALLHHRSNLQGLECGLYSKRFLEFAAESFRTTVGEMCAQSGVIPSSKN